MKKFKLDKEKQKIIKVLLGEDFYSTLYWYQKWLIQIQLTDEDINKFNRIKEFVKDEKCKNNSIKGNT